MTTPALEVVHCWAPAVCMGLAFHAPHTWTASRELQCPGHVVINGRLYCLDRLPAEDVLR